jgi:hypothetical protein
LEEDMDIVVTIPKSEYKNDEIETKDMINNNLRQFWKFNKPPKKLEVGDRMYFVKNNKIESSMRVLDIELTSETCYTTGRIWTGWLVYMDNLKYENFDIKVKGFQGFRYRWW